MVSHRTSQAGDLPLILHLPASKLPCNYEHHSEHVSLLHGWIKGEEFCTTFVLEVHNRQGANTAKRLSKMSSSDAARGKRQKLNPRPSNWLPRALSLSKEPQ